MEPPLFSTKLFVPRVRTGIVPRPRLLERLQGSLDCVLTLVSASAGSGKTTLLAQWIARAEPPVPAAWFSIDEGDNDPVRFWGYFIAALRTIRPGAGETAESLLRSPETLRAESVPAALVNELSEIQDDLALVLDDYHFIKSELVHAGVSFLLEHCPHNVHVIIATRTTPPFHLARFRGEGIMLEIGADDLRFTVDEAATLLAKIPNIQLSANDVSALTARTEGWAVGLAIAASSLGKQTDVRGFIANFAGSHRYVMDYLIEEVLRQQTVELQDFLLKTSILDRLTAPLCEKLTGQSRSREMLAELESAVGGFLIPLDESRQWYRYHHLMAELLRHQLDGQSGPGEVAALHIRASQWFEDNGFPDDAVKYALKARDWAKAICLIDNVSENLVLRGEMLTLTDWLGQVPEAALSTNRPLYRRYVDALITTNEIAAAESALKYLEQTAGEDAAQQGQNALSRADIAWSRGDLLKAGELSRRALALLPAADDENRTRANWVIGRNAFGVGFMAEAESSLRDAYEGAMRTGNQRVAGGALSLLGGIVGERGELSHASGMLNEAIDLCKGSPASAMPECALSFLVHYELNDLESAARLQLKVIEECRASGDYQVLTAGYSYLSYTRLARCDFAGAADALQKADAHARNHAVSPVFHAQVAAFGALMGIRQDDRSAVAHWSARLSEQRSALPSYLSHVPARILIACGEKETVGEQLQSLYEQAAKGNMAYPMLRYRIYQTLAAASPGEALDFLAEALRLGQPEGFMRSFLDEGKQLAPLLRRALHHGITPEYTAKLIKVIASEQRQHHTETGPVASSLQPGPLSEREMEILRLLASGHSNREIAERLYVTAGTVNVHVHNILAKLDARSRSQAVAIARDLNLI